MDFEKNWHNVKGIKFKICVHRAGTDVVRVSGVLKKVQCN